MIFNASAQVNVYLMHVRHSSLTDEASFYLEDEGLNPVELVHPNRPNDSYCGLIRRALLSSPRQRLFLHEIYDYFYQHYSYFRNSGNGWKVKLEDGMTCFVNYFVRIQSDMPCQLGKTFFASRNRASVLLVVQNGVYETVP